MNTKKTIIAKCSKCGLIATCFHLHSYGSQDYYCLNCFDGEYKHRKKWFFVFIGFVVFVLFVCLIIVIIEKCQSHRT